MNEHELTKGNNPLLGDKDELWTARDEQGSEDELSEFLYGLIRFIKPQFILETGCYLGDATIAMAHALKDNKYGTIITCDIEQSRVDEVNTRVQEEGLTEIVKVVKMEGKDLIVSCGNLIDFAFIDSGSVETRTREIQKLLKYLKPMNMFALHDTAPQHSGMCQFANSLDIPKIYLNTPRGLTLFEKI